MRPTRPSLGARLRGVNPGGRGVRIQERFLLTAPSTSQVALATSGHHMNPIDGAIVLWFNHFAGWSGTFDGVVKDISDNYLVQAAVPVTILWGFWFRRAATQVVRRNRELIVVTQLATIVSIAIARGIALIVPFRDRPLATPTLGYHVIDPRWNTDIHQWSSFPSDHAALFFALATGITLLSRRIGIVMLLYATLVDCLPRIYLGLHYPSDLLAGATLGSATVLIAARPEIRKPVAHPVLRGIDAWPGTAYGAMFLCSFGLATMFDSAEQLVRMGIRVALAAARHAHLLHWAAESSALARAAEAIAVVSLLLLGAGILMRRRVRRGRSRVAPLIPENRPRDVSAELTSVDAVPISILDEAASRQRDPWLSPDLLEFTHDAIIIWEMDGAGILYWNSAAEQLYGYSREEAHGRVTHNLLRTRLAAGGGGPELEGRLAKYGIWIGELHHRTRDGGIVQVDARLALMSQRNGRWLVLEVNRDVTDQRRADALRELAMARLTALRDSTPQ